jgi:hypothetical protein
MLFLRYARFACAAALVSTTIAGATVALVTAGASTALSQEPAQQLDEALKARMKAEKDARRDCKVLICDIAHNKKADGDDVACSVVKTWTKTELKEKILKGRLDWPWSHAQCKADIKLPRKLLAQFLSGADVEAKIPKHAVDCTLDRQDGSDKYSVSFAIEPTVQFSGGKAVKASLNWSDIEGTAVAKGAVWSAAKLDNNLGILEGAVVESINDFFDKKCKAEEAAQ